MSGSATTCVLHAPRPSVSACECCSEDTPALHFRRCPRCGRSFEPRRIYRRRRSQTLWSMVREFVVPRLPSVDDSAKIAWAVGDAAVVIALAVAAIWRLVG